MPDVKIKGYSGNELHYADVPKVWLAAEESTEDNPVLVPFTYGEAMDDVEIIPDFSDGDMRVTTPDGYLVRSGVVKKPGSLVPGNIKKGETVAGIPGEYEGEKIELEAVTVDLAMANGDQIIEPSEGKALSKVTVTKPETLVPENIAEGVDIAGIIGTLVTGGTDLPFNIWAKTITGVSLSQNGTTAILKELASPSELPEWADLENIKLVASNTVNTAKYPVYILGLIAKTGSGSIPTYGFSVNVVANVSATSTGKPVFMKAGTGVNATGGGGLWFGTPDSSYSGICVQDGIIYQRAWNGYGVMSPGVTYQLILIKIDSLQ